MATREETLLHHLVVGLPFAVGCTLGIGIYHVGGMLTPHNKVHLGGLFQLFPVSAHTVDVHAGIKSADVLACFFGKLF